MTISFARRDIWKVGAAVLAGPKPAAAVEPPTGAFFANPPELVRETVTVAHGNFRRLKELVDARPALARAAVDWGFGDWEDALGAASHVGNREIAEYLIANGARPTLFSAAMLGQLETVKAFLLAQPGAQKIPGPHSISLLAHAKAGGQPAEAVFQYLAALGDASGPKRPPFTAEEAAALAGTYVFGPQPNDRIEITAKGSQLTLTGKGTFGRGLVHLGEHAFHPVGASSVRVRFSRAGADATLTIHDPELVLTARRLP
ncbi:MAG: hypothetical protein K2X03_20370 [Bryobacteraceae bacterium]|nr:hypothetical protein [Bryobacteraceae bacterium]